MQTLDDIAASESRFQINLYNKRDIALVRGEEVYLWDASGQRYLDMMSNYGISILGHAHPAVTAAITGQAQRLTSCHQSFYSDVRADFLAALARLLPGQLAHMSFSNSGTEAIEAALKYARAATGRKSFISTKRSYHGRTFGALSVTGESKHRAAFEPLLEFCHQVPFGDLEAVATLIGNAAAVVVEPVQGESGIRPAPDGYLEGLRRMCDESGALLILDEVQTAFRTGRNFAFEHAGAVPDIMALAKPLANGLPIGVTCVSAQVAQAIPPGSHGSTFAGNPLVCAAGVATLQIVSEAGFNDRVADLGCLFLERLSSIRHPLIREVRGLGLMLGVELKRNASAVLQQMQRLGVLAIPAGSTTVRFLPPLIIQEEHVLQAADVFEQALDAAG